jgi:hypothetical protein
MSRQVLLTIIGIMLLLSIVAFVWIGCYKGSVIHEGFEDVKLKPKERELFEDLKNDKIPKEEMVKLIKAGILNEQLIDKFLKNLDSSATQLHEQDKAVKEASKTGVIPS